MSEWVPGLTMGIGRGRQQELLAAMEKLVAEEKRKLRHDTIEECARVAETAFSFGTVEARLSKFIAAAIRALKDKP